MNRLVFVLVFYLWIQSSLVVGGKKKKKPKVKNKKKKLLKKESGVIESTNYIGVKIGNRVVEELNWFEANEYCKSEYGTTLATILTEEDQLELVNFEGSGSGLLYSDEWGNAVNRVHIGFFTMLAGEHDTPHASWITSEQLWTSGEWPNQWAQVCEHFWDCSAQNEVAADWHPSRGRIDHVTEHPGVKGKVPDGNGMSCGFISRARRGKIGTWGSGLCSIKKDFICNKKGGKYDPTPFAYGDHDEGEEGGCGSVVNGAGLDIAILIEFNNALSEEEADRFALVKQFVDGFVTHSINDASNLAIVEYSSDDWTKWSDDLRLPWTQLGTSENREIVTETIQNIMDGEKANAYKHSAPKTVFDWIYNEFFPTGDSTKEDLLIVFVDLDFGEFGGNVVASDLERDLLESTIVGLEEEFDYDILDGIANGFFSQDEVIAYCAAAGAELPSELLVITLDTNHCGGFGEDCVHQYGTFEELYPCLNALAAHVYNLGTTDDDDYHDLEDELAEHTCAEASSAYFVPQRSDNVQNNVLVVSSTVFYGFVPFIVAFVCINCIYLRRFIQNRNDKMRFSVKYDAVSVESSAESS